MDRDYDLPIHQAFAETGEAKSLCILDLGANVGYFSLRCMEIYRAVKGNALRLVAVEGAPATFAELRRRLLTHSIDGVDLTLKLGLAGRRAGDGMIYSSLFSTMTNAVVPSAGKTSHIPFLGRHAEKSSYVDVETLFDRAVPVDLLKCDIEGSELEFLKNYASLLQRTRLLVIEIHPMECDAAACRALLSSYGFVLVQQIHSHPTYALEFYKNVSPA